jgi:hypothetical protein
LGRLVFFGISFKILDRNKNYRRFLLARFANISLFAVSRFFVFRERDFLGRAGPVLRFAI